MTILFVLTSRDRFGDTARSTGVWLEELLQPYYYCVENGYQIGFASPKGGVAPIDPASVDAVRGQPIFSRYEDDSALHQALASCAPLRSIDPVKWEAVVYPGGHGPLWDLKDDPVSIEVVQTFLNGNRPLGVICHAGCALLAAKKPDGSPAVRGRRVTAFSDSEEKAIGLGSAVPYVVEAELIQLGARYSKAADWQEHVVVDGNLITGQNPASALGVAAALVARLRELTPH